jgi:uncharacterized protein YfaS (alpha-2-macroglobulin family)
MTRLRTVAASFRRALLFLFVNLFGRWQWDAPPWLRAAGTQTARGGRYLRAHPPMAGALAIVLLGLGGVAYWYATRPTPHRVTFTVVPPGLTEYNDNGISSIKPLVITFSETAAPLRLVKTAVTTGVDLSPALAGTWFWASDRELRFTPKEDWPVDESFRVRFSSRGMVAPEVLLEEYQLRFNSQPFAVRISDSRFYQDPVDPNLKKLVATATFSHPVDPASFEGAVTLHTARDAGYLGLTPDSRHFTVAYDKFRLNAFVHSSPLAMPRDDTPMTLRIEKGVRAARGGNDSTARLEAVVTVPGRSSLRFSNARMAVVDNAKHEPEQILFVASSSPVTERALTGKIQVRLLPVRHARQAAEDRRPYNWRNDPGIGEDILAKSANVPVEYVPADEGGDSSHGFRFRAPVGRYVHVLVQQDVQGTGGYVSGKPYAEAVKVDPYPRALKFLGEGALLSLSGDRRVGFLTRDVDTVEIEIGRVLPNQLQHLARAMWNFAQPNLYGDNEDALVERQTMRRDYRGRTPGKPTYDSIDVGQHLQDASGQRRGVFLLRLRGLSMPPRAGPEGEGDDAEESSRYSDNRVLEDSRLILVTDLGFFVKSAKDGSRDVFVQSIRTGQPVAGARVTLAGANGLTTLAATTDAAGRAHLPAPAPNLPREKHPQMVIVEREGDLSFLPFRSGRRNLEMSRFDTGGVENPESAQQISTYLFSDRGIYRPAETMHLGMITRSADWRAPIAGLPVTVEITDPRGQVVKRDQVTLSAGAFDELTYVPPASAPTGTYEAIAYLVKDPRRRQPIGSTTFRVQEFEPDRLKVQLDLSSAPLAGWLRPADVHARITVAHLFGAAAGGRRVEGELSLTPVLPRFQKFAEYRFQIGEVLKEPHRETLAALTTDDKGTGEFALDLKRFVGRAYRLNVLARAYEAQGGRNVAAQNSAIVSDAAFLVGVKPDGDLTFVRRGSARQAHWLAVNQQLNPVPADGLTLEWVQRKYVSVLTQQNDGTLRYVSRMRETVRSSRTVRIAQGGALFPLPTTEPGEFALVLRDPTGAKLNTLNYSVAGEANVSRTLDRDSELQIQLDKPSYGAGETIGVSVRAPYAGAGLITVERERVFRHHWFKTATTSSVQQITLPPDFEGNGYVTVQFVRDPGSDELFMSPLSYGVAPFGADLSARTQTVGLVAPKLVKPGQKVSMRVTATEPSRVAVLAVDEGILQVARYRSPDPLGYFFQKKMLEVDTSQVLDLVLPDFERFLALAAPGGDADAGFSRHLNPFARKRKAPAAYWSGIVSVGREGRELAFTVPDYFNGRLRIVAIAVSPRRIGVAESATEVRGDFILTPNVPATVTPGDEFIVSVGVYNNTTGGSGPIRLELQPGGNLSLVGAGGVDLQIADRKEGVAEFRVRANAVLGSAPMSFIARRGTSEARVAEEVGIRPAGAYRTTLTLGRTDAASSIVPITRELYAERRDVAAAISTTPLAWGQGLIAFLDEYEYSCTEQLVSKGFSALMVLSRPEFGRLRSTGDQTLDPTFTTIRSRLNDQGGLGLWSSTPETAEFATVYGAHFLIEAKERGQRIPQDVLDRMNDWLTQFATTPAISLAGGRARAYAVYLLARQGMKPATAISNVEQELTNRYPQAWPTDLAAAYLASTYRLMQRTADAERMVRRVPWAAAKRDFDEDIYYGGVVHDAQLLYLLAKHFPSVVSSAPPTALETMGKAVSGNGASSLSAAYTLLALDAFAKTSMATTTLGINELSKDGQARTLTLPPGAIPKVSISQTAARVEFSRRGTAPAYFVLAESGFDRTPAAAEVRQGIEILREFVDDKGAVLSRVTVGQEFFVRLRIRATDRDRHPQIAIVDVLPGGVEPVLELQAPASSSTPGEDPAMARQRGAARALPVGVPEKSDWAPSHIDVREDRLVLYGDALRAIGTFQYRVRANNAGTYQVPPAFAEGLYNRTIVALSKTATLEVIKP